MRTTTALHRPSMATNYLRSRAIADKGQQALPAIAAAHPVLAQLLPLVRESKAMLAAVRELLPPALAAHVAAGKWDGSQWTLLCKNGAAATKLQQMRPGLERALQSRGWNLNAIVIKVQVK
jgi:hypothetical protein